MEAERWRRVDSLLQRALELDQDRRAAFLLEACGTDEDLYHEVSSLVDASDRLDRFMEDPTFDFPLAATAAGSGPSWTGRRIGPYRLLEQLGSGGMSVVYRAERTDAEYEAQVAVKLVRALPGPDPWLTRFRRERQILARLNHPNIARLYDAGTADGLPYVVMELVEGRPVDIDCDRRQLPVAARLELLIEICNAVAYAHRNLVIHRDLKPANILVTADGTPKLLDFGIAKMLVSEPEQPQLTLTGLRPMTPSYASPEQILGLPIGTASDVYSLGVSLYVLLTGQSPYRLEGARREEIERVVVDQEPARPSEAIASAGTSEAQQAAKRRSTSPARLRRTLHGELDTIALMALAKDPERRYGTTVELASDLRRFLRGLPIQARRPTLAYRAVKLVRRQKLAAGFVALLVASASISTQLAVRNAAQRRRIEVEKEQAEAVSTFLVDTFGDANPVESRSATVTVPELLVRGLERIDRELEDRPRLQLALYDTLAEALQRLGRYRDARVAGKRAVTLSRRLLGPTHPATATRTVNLAAFVELDGDVQTAERLYRLALGLFDGVRGREEILGLAHALARLASLLNKQDKRQEAEELHRQALALRRRELPPDDPELASSLHELSLLAYRQGRLAEAAELSGDAVAIWKVKLGGDHPDAIASRKHLGLIRLEQGRLGEAQELLEETWALERRIYGDSHPRHGFTFTRLARVETAKGDLERAEAWARRGLETRLRLLGDDHPAVAVSRHAVGHVLYLRGEPESARELFESSLEVLRRRLPGTEVLTRPLLGLGRIHLDRGEAREALPLLREAVEIRRRALPRSSLPVLEAEAALGFCLAQLGDVTGESMLTETLRRLDAAPPTPQRDRQVEDVAARLESLDL